jgi:hypothetical protein
MEPVACLRLESLSLRNKKATGWYTCGWGFSRKGENYQRAGVLEQCATASTWLVFIKLDCIVEYLL